MSARQGDPLSPLPDTSRLSLVLGAGQEADATGVKKARGDPFKKESRKNAKYDHLLRALKAKTTEQHVLEEMEGWDLARVQRFQEAIKSIEVAKIVEEERQKLLLKESIEKYAPHVRDAVTYTQGATRKTVTSMDVVYALKRQGRTLYGFGG